MPIQAMKVENFTVFKNLEIDFCDGVNIFIGENGTGKTHLLKMLYAFSKADEGWVASKENYNLTESFTWGLNDCFKGFMEELMHGAWSFKQGNTLFSFDSQERAPGGFYIKLQGCSYKNPIPSVFIPAKEMLTHSKGLLAMAKKYSGADIPFDKTLLDVIEKASQWKLANIPDIANNIVPILEKEIGGTVLYENDTFFIVKHDGKKVSFAYEAEGIKKLGLLWQLLMNENITPGTVLLWDEPEANINPKLIPTLVNILLELSRQGVQIFLATHEYNLMKYFSMLKKETDQVAFFSLYKDKETNEVTYEKEDDYDLLEHNPIIDANTKLIEDDLVGVL